VSEISVIGLGAMGSALARALVRSGAATTVWNRTPERGKPLVAEGATQANTIEEAVEAASLILVCIDSYPCTHSLLARSPASTRMFGRILIQLSAGSPNEAREAERWAQSLGAGFLAGAIIAYPAEIGRAEANIIVSGAEPAFRRAEPYLRKLAGDLQYLGPRVGAAAAFFLAQSSYGLGYNMGLIHGALICESEGIGVDVYGAAFNSTKAAMIGERTRRRADIIHRNDFANTGASINVWNDVVEQIRAQARDVGINSEFPDYVSALFKRAIEQGFATEDITATIKVLRNRPRR
jgi:3-hydroxyisobutyrate dehydrogenase-like beta-hydroxyacid dehydrogenase